MTLYMIRGDTVTAYASAPARASEDELRVRSAKEIETSGLSNAQMAAIWNALPGTAPVAKFKDRKTAVQRLWAAFSQLPVASAPAGGSAGRRAGSKQARVIGLLQRPEGATIDEIASATGWQRHTVRGLISGALKKKLGLHVLSEKTDRGRLYRISESRSAARGPPVGLRGPHGPVSNGRAVIGWPSIGPSTSGRRRRPEPRVH